MRWPTEDLTQRPDANRTVREALRSPADVSGKWFVCGEQDDRFELQPANDNSNLVIGVPYRFGKPIGRLEGRVEGDRLKLTAYLTTTEFGPSPMRFEYILDGGILKDTSSRGPLLSRRIQSGGLCGAPAGAFPNPDTFYRTRITIRTRTTTRIRTP